MAALALSLGAVACGDGDDGDGATTFDGTPKQQVEATIRDAWEQYAAAADDAEAADAYCAVMTPVYQQVQVAASGGRAKSCAEAVAESSRAWHKRGYGDLPTKFFSISVNGNVARVKTTGGILGHSTYLLRLVKDGESWKMPPDALKPVDG